MDYQILIKIIVEILVWLFQIVVGGIAGFVIFFGFATLFMIAAGILMGAWPNRE